MLLEVVLVIQWASFWYLVIIKLKIQESIQDNKLLNVNLNVKWEIEVLTTLHKSKHVWTVFSNCNFCFHWRITFPPFTFSGVFLIFTPGTALFQFGIFHSSFVWINKAYWCSQNKVATEVQTLIFFQEGQRVPWQNNLITEKIAYFCMWDHQNIIELDVSYANQIIVLIQDFL